MSYKAIIFDNAGVLINDDHRLWSQKISEYFNQPFKQIYQYYSRGKAWPLYKIGKISEDKFWQMGNKQAGLNLDIKILKKIVREIRTPNREVVELLNILHKSYLLGIINNEGADWDKYSRNKESFYKLFSVIVGSYEVGVPKPELKIYQVLVKKLRDFGFKPNECIYIDDKESNLTPAERLGFKTIHYTNLKNLEHKLSALKII